MENTSYIALSRQAVLRRELEVVANNIANMNTTAFKGEKMMFIDHLVRSRGGERVFGDRLAFVRDIASVRDTTEGALEKTGNPLDLAVRGDAYFVVRTPDGDRYSRNGRFLLDAGGQLVTADGHPVLSDAGQPFFFAPEDGEITIARDGSVSTANGALGRFRLARFERDLDLVPGSAGLYSSQDQPLAVEAAEVVQGVLEKSNIEPIIELSRMIEVNRSYQAVSNLIDREDERIKKMVSELARAA